jgi:hypothetical protein
MKTGATKGHKKGNIKIKTINYENDIFLSYAIGRGTA